MDKKELYAYHGITESEVQGECVCCGCTTWHAKKEDEELLCDNCYNGRQDIVEEIYSIIKNTCVAENVWSTKMRFYGFKAQIYSVMRQHKELFK